MKTKTFVILGLIMAITVLSVNAVTKSSPKLKDRINITNAVSHHFPDQDFKYKIVDPVEEPEVPTLEEIRCNLMLYSDRHTPYSALKCVINNLRQLEINNMILAY